MEMFKLFRVHNSKTWEVCIARDEGGADAVASRTRFSRDYVSGRISPLSESDIIHPHVTEKMFRLCKQINQGRIGLPDGFDGAFVYHTTEAADFRLKMNHHWAWPNETHVSVLPTDYEVREILAENQRLKSAVASFKHLADQIAA